MLRMIKKIFPMTTRGVFFTLFPAIILAAGINRADMAALIWGSAFLLLSLYTYICSHIYRTVIHKYLKTHQECFNIFLPEKGIFPGEEFHYRINLKLPLFILPGFCTILSLVFETEDRKKMIINEICLPGENQIRSVTMAPDRGFYKMRFFSLHFRDILGFSHAQTEMRAEEMIHVFPGIVEAEPMKYKTMSTDSQDKLKSKKTNDELLEVRKYYYGDDLRKINWKMLAHVGELFIRKGEETPPPATRLIFLVDTTVSALVPPAIQREYFDSFINIAASVITAQLMNNHNLFLSLPGLNNHHHFSRQQKTEFLAMMAETNWTDPGEKWNLPPQKGLNCILLSTPGSVELPGIINSLKTKNWEINLFLKDFVFPGKIQETLDLKKILFLPEKQERKKNLSKWEAPLKNALVSELEKYNKSPWRLKNAGIF